MIGNDIIDLQVARKQSNWKRRGWLQKIFTQVEQQCILDSQTPETQIWKLWSMKEAVYKAHQRRFSLSPKFNPKDFEYVSEDKIHVDDHIYSLQTEITDDYIYSHVVTEKIDCKYKIFTEEIDLKHELTQMIKQTFDITGLVSIDKDYNRIPLVYYNKKKRDVQVSLTHHGNYAAFVMNI